MVANFFSTAPGRGPGGWLALTAGCAGLLAGCASDPAPRAAQPAPSIDVGRVEAWQDAELITGLSRDRFTLIGSGESMLPVYGENTVLVITKIDYARLQPGMQVAYMSRGGAQVVHVLIQKEDGGWRVKGLNNEVEDYDRVTPSDLIGVVYASFATNGKSGLGN
jgi:hypothetical protein